MTWAEHVLVQSVSSGAKHKQGQVPALPVARGGPGQSQFLPARQSLFSPTVAPGGVLMPSDFSDGRTPQWGFSFHPCPQTLLPTQRVQGTQMLLAFPSYAVDTRGAQGQIIASRG